MVEHADTNQKLSPNRAICKRVSVHDAICVLVMRFQSRPWCDYIDVIENASLGTGMRYCMAFVRDVGLLCSSFAVLRSVRWTIPCRVFYAAGSFHPPAACYAGHL